jgi:hypothetical protein
MVGSLVIVFLSGCSGSPESETGFKDNYDTACLAGTDAASRLTEAFNSRSPETIGIALWRWVPSIQQAAQSLDKYSESQYDKAGELVTTLYKMVTYSARYAGTIISQEAAYEDSNMTGEYDPLPAPNEWDLAVDQVARICAANSPVG